MSNDASPRAKRRKNKVKLKLSWGTPTKEERIAQQLDDFISDVIESAKREYLSNERQDSFNGDCPIYLNQELKAEMIELETTEIIEHDYSTDNSYNYQGSPRQPSSQEDNCPAGHYRAAELNEGNPLLAGNANTPKRRYLRLLQRQLRRCWHCTCFLDGNDIT
ncbi:uncharacterized protein LOC111137093 isoform X2 [Crassostrea virginica]